MDLSEEWRYGRQPCPICGKKRPKNGFRFKHDPCIANLPGVLYACCGHGIHEAYVMFETGHVIRGKFDMKDGKIARYQTAESGASV
jgi:hypothetical protein